MALQQDFENRRRERLRRQREKRRRMRMIRLGVGAAALIVVIILIIVGISKCAGNNTAGNNDNTNAAVTQVPIESASPVQTQEPQNAIPAPSKGDNDLLDQMVASGQKKHVYLTFDDGPNNTITPQILDILRKYNVKATFFMVGKNIEKTPYMCTRVVEEGHLAAPHSYSHDYGTVYSDDTTFREEVDKTYQLIVANTPGNVEPFKVFRFPGGGYDDSNYGSAKQGYKESLAEMGFYYCDWNTMTGDAEDSSKSASQLLDYFNENRPNLNNLVILMHDTTGKQATVDMLPALIEQLLEEGYTFSRLDEIDYSNASNVSESPSPEATAAAEDEDTPSDSSVSDSSSSDDDSSSSSGSSSSSDRTSSSSSSSSSGSSSSGGSSSGGSSSSGGGSSSGSSSSSGGDEGVTKTTTTTSGTTTTETVEDSGVGVLDPE